MPDLVQPCTIAAAESGGPPRIGWSVECLRRPDPRGGPDAWLIIFTHAGRVAFGAGLDEATAWGRALAAWCEGRREDAGPA